MNKELHGKTRINSIGSRLLTLEASLSVPQALLNRPPLNTVAGSLFHSAYDNPIGSFWLNNLGDLPVALFGLYFAEKASQRVFKNAPQYFQTTTSVLAASALIIFIETFNTHTSLFGTPDLEDIPFGLLVVGSAAAAGVGRRKVRDIIRN